jgi:hypothetical protein
LDRHSLFDHNMHWISSILCQLDRRWKRTVNSRVNEDRKEELFRSNLDETPVDYYSAFQKWQYPSSNDENQCAFKAKVYCPLISVSALFLFVSFSEILQVNSDNGRSFALLFLMFPLAFLIAESRRMTRKRYYLRLAKLNFVQAFCNPDARRELAQMDPKFKAFFRKLGSILRLQLVPYNYFTIYFLEFLAATTPF